MTDEQGRGKKGNIPLPLTERKYFANWGLRREVKLSSPEVKDGKRWTATRKVEVVLAVLKGANVSEVCWKNGISQSQAYAWRDSFLVRRPGESEVSAWSQGSEGAGGQPVGA